MKKEGSVKKRIKRKATRKGAKQKKSVSKRFQKRLFPKKRVPPKRKETFEAIGTVTHYFPKVKAGVVKIKKGTLALGETIHIKGHTTDFKQKVTSIQLDRVSLRKAAKGQEIGLRVKSRVRQNDIVYKLP